MTARWAMDRPPAVCDARDMDLLDDAAIARELAEVSGWERAGDAIVKTVKLADFKAAMDFVNKVAEIAEAQNHHPDITIQWNKVTLTLSTHSAGGLTANDFGLARQINAI
jgi:4a-hydroxytetrahydrobiopterin dehydratase